MIDEAARRFKVSNRVRHQQESRTYYAMPYIEHISFDLWMTLIRTHPAYKQKRAELFCRWFAIADLSEAEKMIRKTDLMANHINETTGGNLDAFELYLIVLHQLNAKPENITLERLKEFYFETEQLFLSLPPVPIDPSVTDAFRMLQESGITMNILSNTGFVKGYMLRRFLHEAGWDKYFLFCIFSDETGHSKPNMSMFSDVWETLKQSYPAGRELRKNQVFHFGDNQHADVDGAEEFGFKAGRFHPDGPGFYLQVKTALHATGVLTT